jgi:RNA recognition motif-containing protein
MLTHKKYTIYVCNLAPSTTKVDLAKHFDAAGFSLGFIHLLKTKKIGDRIMHLERASAFAVLEGNVQLAVEQITGTELLGRRINVQPYEPERATPKPSTFSERLRWARSIEEATA